MSDALPDSRLIDKRGTVMADWPVIDADGTQRTIRLELEPIFCLNCGKPSGYVPMGVMTFVSWMCQACSVTWGKEACLHKSSDEEFWAVVHSEMVARWGRGLTQIELNRMAEKGNLGRTLELLERESPYKGMQQS